MKAMGEYDMRRKMIRDTETFLARHVRRPAPTALVLLAAQEDMDRLMAAEARCPADGSRRGR